MSNKRLKIENLENLQELNAEEFSSIQGGYYNTPDREIDLCIDDSYIGFDISEIDDIEYISEAGGIGVAIDTINDDGEILVEITYNFNFFYDVE